MIRRRDFFKYGLATAGIIAGKKLLAGPVAGAADGFSVRLESEENIYRYVPANNGAGPMWGNGMTTVVRVGDDVYACGLETDTSVKGLSNCRWMLFRRYRSGWKLEARDLVNLTREPASLAVRDQDRILLTANPKLADSCTEYCLTQPEILSFDRKNLHHSYERLIPEWKTNPGFNDHSYRAFAVDRQGQEMIFFQNYMYHHAEWSFRDRHGRWVASDAIKWPLETYAGKEVPLRLCYSNVAVRDRKVFFFATADVVEPVEEWKAHKLAVTGSQWDYVFRRLFFCWSDDITKGKFHSWIEIANRDKTAGYIRNQDMWLSPDGRVYLLWTEKAIDERLHGKFFPDEKQEQAIHCAIVADGKIQRRITVLNSKEGDAETLAPVTARFQATPDGRLFVVYYISGSRADGSKISENRITEIGKDGRIGSSVVVPFKKPFTSFQTANERAGCGASAWLDMIGIREGEQDTISYASILIN